MNEKLKMSGILTRTGVFVKLDDLLAEKGLLTKLKKYLTVRTIKFIGRGRNPMQHVSQLYTIVDIPENDKKQLYIKIPKFVAIGKSSKKDSSGEANAEFMIEKLDIKNSLNKHDNLPDDKFEGPGIEPRSNQPIILKHLMKNVYTKENIKNGTAGCVLVMDTGQGKTFVGGKIIENLKRKTLIVVPRMESVGTEWFQMFATYYPNLTIGRYDSKKKIDGDVVLSVINSLYDKKEFKIGKKTVNADKFLSRFGLVIFDEVHRYGAQEFQKVFWKVNSCCMLGLTATPDERQDGFDNIYPMFIGPIIDASTLKGYKGEQAKWEGEIRAVQYHGPPKYTKHKTNKVGTMSTMAMCKQITSDPYRTKLVIKLIMDMYKKGKYIYVFSELRDYIELLVSVLREKEVDVFNDADYQDIVNGKVKKSKIHSLMGGATMAELIEARKNARIVITTYSYGIEGVSIVRMNCLILATPRRNKMKQATGRILRMGGNSEEKRIIYDIIDSETGLKSQFSTRKKVYTKRGFPVKNYKYKWEEFKNKKNK